jgi:hypothetical protein
MTWLGPRGTGCATTADGESLQFFQLPSFSSHSVFQPLRLCHSEPSEESFYHYEGWCAEGCFALLSTTKDELGMEYGSVNDALGDRSSNERFYDKA